MIFHRSEPNEHYGALRLVSMEGGWELGLSLRPTGTRLRMGRMKRPPSVLDFCMGTDAAFYAEIFQAVLSRLELMPETATAAEIDAAFPWAGTRPELAVHLLPLLAEAGETMAASLSSDQARQIRLKSEPLPNGNSLPRTNPGRH